MHMVTHPVDLPPLPAPLRDYGNDDICARCGEELGTHLKADGQHMTDAWLCPDDSGFAFIPSEVGHV